MDLTLRRDYHGDDCTLGILRAGGRSSSLHTIERPWRPDQEGRGGCAFISCVPRGTYRLTRHTRPSGEQTWALSNPGLDVFYLPDDAQRANRASCARTLILIHAGNYWWDVVGCIAVGRERRQYEAGKWMVTHSRDSMNRLRTLIGSTLDLTLTITHAEDDPSDDASDDAGSEET